MLTEEMIQENRNRFIELVSSIQREDADIDRLLKKLDSSDFFYAPASSIYDGSYVGGLCEHCLRVYDYLESLVVKVEASVDESGGVEYKRVSKFDEDSLIIVALFHDFRKMNYYEKTVKNKKVYSENGLKQDEVGLFDWVSEVGYKIRDEKFVYGTDGQTSEFMIRQFIPLTLDESVAIVNCKGDKDGGSAYGGALCEIYKEYPLAVALHCADMMATYYGEEMV